jgi:chromosome partitioning protein
VGQGAAGHPWRAKRFSGDKLPSRLDQAGLRGAKCIHVQRYKAPREGSLDHFPERRCRQNHPRHGARGRSRAGRQSAAIFDLDPQASASFWKDTRQTETPAVTAIPSARLQHTLKAAEEAGCDLAIIDAPPFAKDIAFEAAQHADFVLIPTKPAVLDLMAMTRTLELLRHYQKPSAVVMSFCPPAGRELEDTVMTVMEFGATLCPVRIHSRVAYSRAQQTGQTAQEFEPQGKAAEEIAELYAYTCIQLRTDETGAPQEAKLAASGS